MSRIRYDQINWEDESEGLATAKPEADTQEDFATLLESKGDMDQHRFRPGEQITGKVIATSESSGDVLIDLGGHVTGILDHASATGDEGREAPKVGEEIRAYVITANDFEVRLSLSLSHSKQNGHDIYLAFRNQVPVRGKVEKENKGGFDVMVLGRRAFCPVSQIDLKFVTEKAAFIGKEFDFLVEKVEEGGRNVVVSRAAVLKREAENKIQEIEDRVANGDDVIFEGNVGEVRDYGAFVDLGPFEGFVHVSELSHIRVRAHDFVSRGDRVRVKVIKIETVNGKRRVSLSMRGAAEDPWNSIQERLKVGGTTTGKVTRLDTFGAFVALVEGIEGLIHISEMSWSRKLRHPSEVLKVGDSVMVSIVSIDPTTRRIGLSLKAKDEDPWRGVASRLPVGTRTRGKVTSLKGFGALVALETELEAFLPISTLKKVWGESYRKQASPPREVDVVIASVDETARRILLTLPEAAGESHEEDYRSYLAELAKKDSEVQVPTKGMGTFGALLAKKLGAKT